jgi:hypothetical protein
MGILPSAACPTLEAAEDLQRPEVSAGRGESIRET